MLFCKIYVLIISDLSDSLWKCRRKLAASISRMRIKYGALQLSNLLPIHLQNEKVAIAATNPIITGWVNPFFVRFGEYNCFVIINLFIVHYMISNQKKKTKIITIICKNGVKERHLFY